MRVVLGRLTLVFFSSWEVRVVNKFHDHFVLLPICVLVDGLERFVEFVKCPWVQRERLDDVHQLPSLVLLENLLQPGLEDACPGRLGSRPRCLNGFGAMIPPTSSVGESLADC